MRAPNDRGKTTTMPAARPAPWNRSVPLIETSCGLVLHRSAGTQETREIRTGGALAGLAGSLAAAGTLPAVGEALVGAAPPALPVAGVPPAPVAARPASGGSPKRDAAIAAMIAASRVDRLWARVYANVLLRAYRDLELPPVGWLPARRARRYPSKGGKPRYGMEVAPADAVPPLATAAQ
jgi:hypothetical protein